MRLLFEEIADTFLKTGSIKQTVEETGFNEYKVRRVLITLGLWKSQRSREIQELLDQRLKKEDIAKRLFLSIKGVESYMPYTRGAYYGKETRDSFDSRNYRKRMRTAVDRQVAVNETIQKGGNREVKFNDLEGLRVYKIKLSLDTEYADTEVLRKYGKAKEGITRTVLVPSSMQLNALNYAIQKCFGWQNSHLHRFVLSEETFADITKGDLNEWKRLAGVYFRCYYIFDDDEDDFYYLDNYDGKCSFKTWLKKKYRGWHNYDPVSERLEVAQHNAAEVEILKGTPGETLAEQLLYALAEFGGEELLERLELKNVFDLDNEFYYEYDYGDGWTVKIELLDVYVNRYAAPAPTLEGFETVLMDENRYDCSDPDIEGELREPVRKVMAELSPVCIGADGMCVFDDVGGIHGFCEFLKGLHGIENDHGYVKDDLEWAKSLGWRPVMPKAESIL